MAGKWKAVAAKSPALGGLSLAPDLSGLVASALQASTLDEATLRSLSDEQLAARLEAAGLSGLVPVIK